MAHCHELSPILSKYLDRHLVFPLLEFLQEKGIYDEVDIYKAKLALLDKTNMVDFAMDIYKSLNNVEEVPVHMKEHRSEVVARLRQLQHEVEPIVKCLENPAVVRNFRQDKAFNLQFLQDDFQINAQHVESLYQYARFQFECGNYTSAADLLQSYRSLCTNSERNTSALWGKLAAEILMQENEKAKDDIGKLRDAIDNSTFASPLMQLQQRTTAAPTSSTLFFSPPYLAAIQINAPHLLRYLAVAVVINKRKRAMLKELLRTVQSEAYAYSDPITQFVECLFGEYDFDGAQQMLKECEAVIDNDFFLTLVKAEFLENARLFIFETYCRIHQSVSISLLADRLNMDQEAAEKWITGLITHAKLNAKIDSKSGTVVMGVQSQGIHEQLVDKAKQLSVRTFMLANTVVGSGKA
ncbi:MAG: hypothetical protein WDW38_004531 [Sanguina aurantia]